MPQRRLGDGGRAVVNPAQMIVAPLRDVGHCREAGLDHRRHQHRQADTLLAKRADDLGRVEIGLDEQAAAGIDTGERRRVGRGRVKDRRNQQHALAWPYLQREADLRQMRNHGGVGQHSAFGVAGCAAGVHLVQIVVGRDLAVRRSRRIFGDPIMVVVPA
jgi:hypothetical protein